jgi:hypothetical protein
MLDGAGAVRLFVGLLETVREKFVKMLVALLGGDALRAAGALNGFFQCGGRDVGYCLTRKARSQSAMTTSRQSRSMSPPYW